MKPLVSVTGLHRSHGPVAAVDGVDLRVDAGEVVALLGPNGAGKTTLTNCLIGLLEPHAGTVTVLDGSPRRAAVRRRVGVVQQDVGFPTTLRVGEVVAGAAIRVGRDVAAATEALDDVGLTALAGQRAARLSGGEQRRLQLAMALVADPRLLILDEPTEGLDVGGRRAFWRTLAARRDEGTGVLLTTHAVAEAAEVSDRVVVLRAGRVVAEGTPEQLTARVDQRRIRAVTSIDPGTVAGWPAVREVAGASGHLDIVADPVEDTVRRLLSLDPNLRCLTVTGASLADAVAALGTVAVEDVA